MAMIYCRECGKKYSDKSKSCPKCGYTDITVPNNSMVVYILLVLLFGCWGIHKFYAGRSNEGIAMLIMGTIGWLLIIPGIIACIWALIDFVIALVNINHPETIFHK